MTALLEIKNLQTHFHIGKRVIKAVDGVTISVQPGEILAIVGESGCGKSVTAMSIMRLLPSPPAKHSGQVLFEGHDILNMPMEDVQNIRGKEISMIFQEPMTSLNPAYKIGDQIAETVRVHHRDGGKVSKKAAWDRAVEMLEKVGIPGAAQRARQYPHQMSGGMRQRVMIAMALACNPKLLLADEPTTALDVTIQAQILDLIRDLAQEFNTALVLITHDLGVVAEMAQNMAVMYAGRVVEQGAVADVFDRPHHPYTAGLLDSIPRLDGTKKQRLHTIEGMVPDLAHLPQGCTFADRCEYGQPLCRQKKPELQAVDGDRQVACHYPLNLTGGVHP
ncbi:ATP-binding cassette domain-containing protein [Heliobacillus mobilis]|uniref:ATP-binding cassette domain-containing protein n=1 Tax=Heliobacterium mobile TaxID=28064 RepID=A0A6I3SJT3_HELMO|nr:ABC transporter ATP-binding protein [Heliobacterium mobile]MTV49150.1 ATP-binding cassette domain-containing protein [Heliobacterium mobile]